MTNYSKISIYKKFTNLFINAWDWLSNKQNVYKLGAMGFLLTLASLFISIIKDNSNAPTKAIEINTPITSGRDTYFARDDINNYGASPEKVAEIASKYQHAIDLKDGVINEKEVVIKSLKETINAISQGQYGTKAQNQSALNALALGNTTEAKNLLTEAAKNVESDTKEGAKTYIHLASLAYLDSTQEAINACRRALELDPDNPDASNLLGTLLYKTGDYAGAEINLKRVERYGETHKNNSYTLIAYTNLGNIYIKQKKFDLAINYLNKAIKDSKASNNKMALSTNYGNLAALYLEPETGNLTEAYKYIQLSMNLDSNNPEAMATNYQMLGDYYSYLKDWPNAINATKTSLSYNESLKRSIGIADNYYYLAYFYYIDWNADEALKFTNKCLDLAKKEGFQPEIGSCYKLQGAVYEERGEIGKAKISYQLSLDTFNKINNSSEVKILQGIMNSLIK
jgi:tetratricopeptide (TPR) repeat protein